MPESGKDDGDVFQRTAEELTLTKAEMSRINKAIDRVLEKVKMENAATKTTAVLDKSYSKEQLAERLIAQIEKEKSMILRARQKREKTLEREQIAAKKAEERETKRLEQLDAQLAKHTAGEEMDEAVVYANIENVDNEQ